MSIDFQRSESPPQKNRRSKERRDRRVSRMDLPSKQRAVLDIIIRYYRATGEACPAAHIARRIDRHHSTIQEHLSALYTKGWLLTPNAPATPQRW